MKLKLLGTHFPSRTFDRVQHVLAIAKWSTLASMLSSCSNKSFANVMVQRWLSSTTQPIRHDRQRLPSITHLVQSVLHFRWSRRMTPSIRFLSHSICVKGSMPFESTIRLLLHRISIGLLFTRDVVERIANVRIKSENQGTEGRFDDIYERHLSSIWLSNGTSCNWVKIYVR